MLSAKPNCFSPHWLSANRNNVFEDSFENDTKKTLTCDMFIRFSFKFWTMQHFFNRHIFSWSFWWPHLLNIVFPIISPITTFRSIRRLVRNYMKLTLSLNKRAWVKMNSSFSLQINVKYFNSHKHTQPNIPATSFLLIFLIQNWADRSYLKR